MKISSVLIGCLGAVLLLNSCSVTKEADKTAKAAPDGQQDAITGRRWKLFELQGKPVPDSVNGKEPFLMLQKEDNRYSASGGCNGIGGTFTLLNNGRIKFTRGMSTMMACPDMSVETGLNDILPRANNYTLAGDTLSLNQNRMAPLARFRAVK